MNKAGLACLGLIVFGMGVAAGSNLNYERLFSRELFHGEDSTAIRNLEKITNHLTEDRTERLAVLVMTKKQVYISSILDDRYKVGLTVFDTQEKKFNLLVNVPQEDS